MTRPKITVVDVPVKAMTTGKRKAAGKPKSWRVWVAIKRDTGNYLAGGTVHTKRNSRATREEVRKYVEERWSGFVIVRATLTIDGPPKPQRRRKS